MYGGLGKDILNDLCRLDVERLRWSRLRLAGKDSMESGRFGHTMCAYKNQLLIFGGEENYDESTKMRFCYNDVRVITLADADSSQQQEGACIVQLLRTSGDYIQPRRNHSAVIVGRHLLGMTLTILFYK